jgi:hypothetical protein
MDVEKTKGFMINKRLIYFFFIILIIFASTGHLHAGPGKATHTVTFTGNYNNRKFNHKQLQKNNVALLPIRSSMGGGGTEDDQLNDILVDSIKIQLPKVHLFTDKMVDKFFTEKDMWEEYFSYITQYMGRGLVKVDEMEKLYSNLKITKAILVTSDFHFSGVGNIYPKEYNIFLSVQIYDIKKRKIIWDGMVNAHDFIKSKKDEDKSIKKVYWEVADKLLAEIMR